MYPHYFIILSGDQVYKIDFMDCLNFHIKNNSELTIITKEYDGDDLNRFGIAEIDSNRRIISFEEKPENPKSNNISLGIYLFNKDKLIEYLTLAEDLVDFGSDLIPYIIKNNKNVYSYNYDGLFMDLGTIESLYYGNMYFLDNPKLLENRHNPFKIYTRPSDYLPVIIRKGAKVKNASISDGAYILGDINHSVISFNVTIEEGASITDSVLLPGVTIKKGSKLKNVLVDEGTIIKENSILEFDTVTLIDNDYFKE